LAELANTRIAVLFERFKGNLLLSTVNLQ